MSVVHVAASAVLLLTALMSAAPLRAQSRLNVDIRPSIVIPRDVAGYGEFHAGPGLGAGVDYRFGRLVSVYAGWDWFTSAYAGKDQPDVRRVSANGPRAGIQIDPSLSDFLSGRFAVGTTYKHIDFRWWDESLEIQDGFGLEASAGIGLSIGRILRLNPGVRYGVTRIVYEVSLPDRITGEPGATSYDRTLKYVSIEFALSHRVGRRLDSSN